MSNRFDTAIILDSTTYNPGSGPTDNSSGYIGFGISGDEISSSGPRILVGSGAPTATAPLGSVYLRTDTAGLYQNTNGTTTWAQLGSLSTGSITLTDNSADAFEFIEGATPYLRFVTTNGAERVRSDVSWDFGSTAAVAVDFDIADNTANALEIRAGASGVQMLGFTTTNGAEVLTTATTGLTTTAAYVWTLVDANTAALSFGSAGAAGMLVFDTSNAAELISIGAASGLRLNTNSPLRFGTAGTALVFTPDGTDLNISGTGAVEYQNDVVERFGTAGNASVTYVSASNLFRQSTAAVSAAGASAGSSSITIVTGARVTTDAAVGTASGTVSIATGASDVTNAGGTGGGSGPLQFSTGAALSTAGAASGNTGAIQFVTGDSTDGNSGDIQLATGTAGATRGVLDINAATVDFSTQGTSFVVIDNTSNALLVSQGNSVYVRVDTTNSAENISLAVPSAGASTVAPTLRTAASYSPRFEVVDRFPLRPQLAASVANANASKITCLIGTNAADANAAFNTGGGVTLTTAGAANDQMLVRGHATAGQSAMTGTTWSTSNQLVYRAVIRVQDTANIVIGAGLKTSLTAGATLLDNATDANQIWFGYATDDRFGVGAANWAAVIRIGAASANVSLGAIATGLNYLTLTIDSSRICRFYLNGALAATSAAITAATSLLPFAGCEALAAAGRQMGVCFLGMEAVYP